MLENIHYSLNAIDPSAHPLVATDGDRRQETKGDQSETCIIKQTTPQLARNGGASVTTPASENRSLPITTAAFGEYLKTNDVSFVCAVLVRLRIASSNQGLKQVHRVSNVEQRFNNIID